MEGCGEFTEGRRVQRKPAELPREAICLGIRWAEDGAFRQQSGLRTRTEGREWFDENVAPRLRRAAPSPDVTLDEFAELFLNRHGATVAKRTRDSLEERLAPARAVFGSWTLRELEGAATDIAGWRATLSDTSRYRLTSPLRQALGAAQRWSYINKNTTVTACKNPQPRADEVHPSPWNRSTPSTYSSAPATGRSSCSRPKPACEQTSGTALERRDVDRASRAVTVQRRYADGTFTPYPKTERSRRRVPLTARALDAIDRLPPRVDTTLLFPAVMGGPIGLDSRRTREWYPALEAAGLHKRGPYHLRHTFATEALAAGVTIFELARLMGTSVAMIDRTYGHLARDSEAAILARLEARGSVERQEGRR